MGKIIIDQRMIGTKNFFNVALQHANNLCEERKTPKEEVQQISQELGSSPDILEFRDRYKKHFGDEIKLIIDNDNK